MSHMEKSWKWLTLWALLAVALGCQDPAGENAKTINPDANSAAAQRASVERETWDAAFIDGAKVGHTHTVATMTGTEDEPLVKTVVDSELRMQRFGQSLVQRSHIETTEKPDGTPVSFTASTQAGQGAIVATGDWQGDQVVITASLLGKTEKKTIPWKEEYRGIHASETSLREDPLEPGEKREFTTLVPLMNQLGQVTLKADDYETTELFGGGETELLKVQHRTVVGGTTIDQTVWVDKEGEVLKAYMPQLKQYTYRTTKEVATGQSDGKGFDLGEASIVRVAKPIPSAHQTNRIAYKATIANGQIEGTFASGVSQSVKVLDEHTAEITVQAVRPNQPEELEAKPEPPTKADLAPNNLVQSDDKQIIAMAQSVAAKESDPWKVALALERYVHQTVKSKNFTQAFASAAEVAESREGDCTEHAVLLAALCRARQIPARGAIGLVYYSEGKGFAYHMWTEVWIEDRWIPLDATLARGGIGAGHLKLKDTNLQGADALTAFLPVFNVLGQLKLEVLEVK